MKVCGTESKVSCAFHVKSINISNNHKDNADTKPVQRQAVRNFAWLGIWVSIMRMKHIMRHYKRLIAHIMVIL